MADVQVMCVNKPNRYSTHEAITHLGGTAEGGWRMAVTSVINTIRSGTNTFYTLVNGKRANIRIVRGTSGREHVQTEADGRLTNNLLELPECPTGYRLIS